MKACVCVKAVPDSETVTFDTETGTLKRTGKEMMINPCDAVAIEAALEFVRKNSGNLTAVSMGPYEAGLRTALAMGAQEAFLLRSAHFAGADVLATAYTLSCYFKKYTDFDVIFCGKHSADGDTGQTGAMLAEFLGIPHVCGVSRIIGAKDGRIEVVQQLDNKELVVEMKTPCLIVIQNNFCIPGPLTLQGILKAKRHPVVTENEKSLEILDVDLCGLKGSATRVIHMFVPPNTRMTRNVELRETEILKGILKGL